MEKLGFATPGISDSARFPHATRNSDRAIRALVMGFAIAIVATAGILAAFSPRVASAPTFSGQVKTAGSVYCGYGCLAIYGFARVPSNVNVSLQWTDISGGVVNFGWWYAGPWIWCGGPGSAGSCVFHSLGGNYTFAANDAVANQTSQRVNYTGSY